MYMYMYSCIIIYTCMYIQMSELVYTGTNAFTQHVHSHVQHVFLLHSSDSFHRNEYIYNMCTCIHVYT